MKRKIFVVSIVILLVLPNMADLESQSKGRILFDVYHAAIDLTKFQGLLSELENEGYTTESSLERISPSILSRENYDVFVLLGPCKSFSDEEEAAIRDFVKDGGGLIIFGEGGPRMRSINIITPINNISAMFGIQFNEDTVVDPERKIEGFDLWEQLVISNFNLHPVTRGVRSIGYLYGCSLTLKGSAIPLAFGAETTSADGKEGKDVVVLAAAEYGKGRVVAMGDYDFLIVIPEGDFLSILDNRKLGLNMFEWVSQSFIPAPTTPPPDTAEAERRALEGYTYFSQGEYSQAKLEFEKALETYSKFHDSQKVSEMQDMIDECDKGLDAEAAFQRGADYYNQKNYSAALADFEESKQLYSAIGDSTMSSEAQEMIDLCNKGLDADAAYRMGEEYFEREEYESALAEFEKSTSLYSAIGDNQRSQDAQSEIDLCRKLLNAVSAYEEGLEYYNKEKYELAISKFDEAISLYKEVSSTEEVAGKVGEAEDRKEAAGRALDDQRARTRMIRVTVILMVVVAAFVLVYIFLRRRQIQEHPDTQRPEVIYCTSCGAENVEGTLYCKKCKKPLKPLEDQEIDKVLEDVRRKFEDGDITEEEYNRITESLKEGFTHK